MADETNRGEQTDFLTAFRGRFIAAMRWHHLDALWEAVRQNAGQGWFVYAVGEAPPTDRVSEEQLDGFLDRMDRLLREEHQEDYCGIVYADDLSRPQFVKIYDPNNLGVVCGFSDSPPLPAWILSQLPPCDLPAQQPVTGRRRRWWRAIFGG